MNRSLAASSIVSGAGLRLSMVGGLGAKVTSLRLAGGREWVAPPARPLTAPLSPDQPWGELDCSGWDECFPNIGADPGIGLVDHGEVWRHGWDLSQTTDAIRAQTSTPEYSFARTATVIDRTLALTYELRNTGARTLDWAWAQHPLLAVDGSTRLLMPRGVEARVEAALEHLAPTSDSSWLAPHGELPATQTLHASQGRAAKLWLTEVPSYVAAVHGDDWIVWHLDRSTSPHVGIWVNLGGWGDPTLRHLAVEPAFGRFDEPAQAYRDTADWRLSPGAAQFWTVTIEVGTGERELKLALDR